MPAGLRNDGAQMLLGCYQRIREVESMRGIPSGVDLCFGLHLTQGVQCGSCGKVRGGASALPGSRCSPEPCVQKPSLLLCHN